MALAAVRSKLVVLLLIVTHIVGFCYCSMFVLRYFLSILVLPSSGWRRDLVVLLCLSSCYLVIVVWLFLTMQWVCLQFVIVVFPDHTQNYCSNVSIDMVRCLKKIW